jgi:cold shock protein
VNGNVRISGTVKWFNAKKGYGFLQRHDTPNAQQDVFVHVRDLPEGVDELKDGQRVSFEIAKTKKGERATNVTIDK